MARRRPRANLELRQASLVAGSASRTSRGRALMRATRSANNFPGAPAGQLQLFVDRASIVVAGTSFRARRSDSADRRSTEHSLGERAFVEHFCLPRQRTLSESNIEPPARTSSRAVHRGWFAIPHDSRRGGITLRINFDVLSRHLQYL